MRPLHTPYVTTGLNLNIFLSDDFFDWVDVFDTD